MIMMLGIGSMLGKRETNISQSYSRPFVRPRGKFITENKLRVVYGCQLVPYGTSELERVNNETHA